MNEDGADMDEKQLSQMSDDIRQSVWTPSNEEGDELIRLARLGLFAEKHAIPALKAIEELLPLNERDRRTLARDALAALPKELKEN